MESQAGSKLSRLITYLSCDFDNYPFQEAKDFRYFERLIREFQDLDLEEELKQYHAWILDQPEHKKIYYRSRFRTWLKNSREFHRGDRRKSPFWLTRMGHASTRY